METLNVLRRFFERLDPVEGGTVLNGRDLPGDYMYIRHECIWCVGGGVIGLDCCVNTEGGRGRKSPGTGATLREAYGLSAIEAENDMLELLHLRTLERGRYDSWCPA